MKNELKPGDRVLVTAGHFKLTQGVVVASFDGSSDNMQGHNHVQHDGEDFARVYGPEWLEKLEDITFCSTCGEDRPVGGSCPNEALHNEDYG